MPFSLKLQKCSSSPMKICRVMMELTWRQWFVQLIALKMIWQIKSECYSFKMGNVVYSSGKTQYCHTKSIPKQTRYFNASLILIIILMLHHLTPKLSWDFIREILHCRSFIVRKDAIMKSVCEICVRVWSQRDIFRTLWTERILNTDWLNRA